MKSLLNRCHAAWERLWFRDSSPYDLGVFRILFFGSGFIILCLLNSFSEFGNVSGAFWYPISFFSYLFPVPPSTQFVSAMDGIWRASMVFSCIGFLTPISVAAATITGMILIGISHCFGIMHHEDAPYVLACIPLMLSDCGRALSVDALLRRRFGFPFACIEEYPGRYSWPLRSVQFIFAFLFTSAGIAKIVRGGHLWLEGKVLHDALVWVRWTVGRDPSFDFQSALNQWLVQQSMLLKSMAWTTVLVELAAPLAFFIPAAALVLVPVYALAHCLIFASMFIPFKAIYPLYFAWIPWTRLFRRLVDSSHRFKSRPET